MANIQGICTSFKTELLSGIHALGTSVVRAATTPDTFKAALYAATASVSSATTTYSASGEVTGTGYTAGGTPVAFIAPAATGTTAFTTPSASMSWTITGTLSASFDSVLIYNASQGNRAVSVHTFTSQNITNGTLTLTMPTNNSATGLIRLS